MNKNSGSLLRDIRNMKRNTSVFPSPQDVITSAKELKKIKSSQQINVNSFMDNKHEKIKNIDEKLEVHQSEIEKNNSIIQDLTNEFLVIKDQMVKEKEKTLLEERKNKLLREEIERTNKLLRVKSLKVDQLLKVKDHLEKELESGKVVLQKNEEYIKTIASLRKQISTIDEHLQDQKHKVQEKDREIHSIKEKTAEITALKAQIQLHQAELSAKDSIINNYKINIHEYSTQKDRDITQRLNLEKEIERQSIQIDNLQKAKLAADKSYLLCEERLKEANQKLREVQGQRNSVQSKIRSHESEESRARNQLKAVKDQSEEMIGKYNQKVSECNIYSSKLQKSQQKVKDLELKIGQLKDQKEKFSLVEGKFEQLKGRGKSLESLYNAMVPQIQCPYGHELKQPVTIIPCGHNFCLGCKKGYSKECSQCKGKLKIEAVYRNELMDDIIGIINSIKQVVELIK